MIAYRLGMSESSATIFRQSNESSVGAFVHKSEYNEASLRDFSEVDRLGISHGRALFDRIRESSEQGIRATVSLIRLIADKHFECGERGSVSTLWAPWCREIGIHISVAKRWMQLWRKVERADSTLDAVANDFVAAEKRRAAEAGDLPRLHFAELCRFVDGVLKPAPDTKARDLRSELAAAKARIAELEAVQSTGLLRPLSDYVTTLTDPAEIRITAGECLEELRKIPDNTYDCCVTSPPYYFVRDYGDARQVGLERTRQAYIDRMVEIFKEVHRTLKPGGTCWLNIADNYCTRRAIRPDGKRRVVRKLKEGEEFSTWKALNADGLTLNGEPQFRAEGIREGSMFNIPHMLVEQLCQRGWYFRGEFIWFKTAMAPEKQRDAPLHATEYVFLLTKSPSSHYTYNGDVLRERGSGGSGRPHRNLWEIGASRYVSPHTAIMPEEVAARAILTGSNPGDLILDPFGGAGTTGAVARLYGRRAHLIELNADYIQIARDRIDML